MLLVTPMLVISIAIHLSSKGSVLYWSDRVGKNNKIFKMPKFRSMLIDMSAVATHLLDNPGTYLSPIGDFLRRSSLDELLKGCETRWRESLTQIILCWVVNFSIVN